MMTPAQVVKTSVNVTLNSPSQDYTHPDDHNLPNYDMTPGFKPFTVLREKTYKDIMNPFLGSFADNTSGHFTYCSQLSLLLRARKFVVVKFLNGKSREI